MSAGKKRRRDRSAQAPSEPTGANGEGVELILDDILAAEVTLHLLLCASMQSPAFLHQDIALSICVSLKTPAVCFVEEASEIRHISSGLKSAILHLAGGML